MKTTTAVGRNRGDGPRRATRRGTEAVPGEGEPGSEAVLRRPGGVRHRAVPAGRPAGEHDRRMVRAAPELHPAEGVRGDGGPRRDREDPAGGPRCGEEAPPPGGTL